MVKESHLGRGGDQLRHEARAGLLWPGCLAQTLISRLL